jgi:hypothetical protein
LGGSIESSPVEGNPFRKKQLLQPLSVAKWGLYQRPAAHGKNALCEGQNAFYVEFVGRVVMPPRVAEKTSASG